MTIPELREVDWRVSSHREMTVNDYQRLSRETAVYNHKRDGSEEKAFFKHPLGGLTYSILGLTGEAGELANKLKKYIRGGVDVVDTNVLSDELGDVLWYVASIAHELGIDLESVAQQNLNKLAARKAASQLKEHA